MPALLAVSLLWAFSFGLVKGQLTPFEPALVAALRLGLAALVFLPFLRPRAVHPRDVVLLLLLGALQFGVMYTSYIAAFQWLHAHEVALLTVSTPIYVVLVSDLLQRRFQARGLVAALLAVAGAAVVSWTRPDGVGFWQGAGLVQVSNAAFAVGQVGWVRFSHRHPGIPARSVFGWLYLGGVAFTAAFAALRAPAEPTPWAPVQVATVVYLGVVASGLGFFLWNRGAARTSPAVLAVMNDVKIPLAVAVSVLVFGEDADPARLLPGLGLVAAAWVLATRAGRGDGVVGEHRPGTGAGGRRSGTGGT